MICSRLEWAVLLEMVAGKDSTKCYSFCYATKFQSRYFHIADMAVHPEHQKRGLGDAIVKALLRKIKQEAPKDGEPYISLLADKPGRRLYERNGFVETAPHSLGMMLK